jgi:hypothetical protein
VLLEAVIRAAGRGVHCLLLIDALGARNWSRSPLLLAMGRFEPGRVHRKGKA